MTPEQLEARNAAIRAAWEDPLRLALARKPDSKRSSPEAARAYYRDYYRRRKEKAKMRATELIEKFNEVIRLTQDAWRLDGLLQGEGSLSPTKLERSKLKHQQASQATKEFCALLSEHVAS
jgi:hypothetical protein